ncbi:hypothetical protein OAL58_08825 [Verrucomicrobia bacterium]|nr:hypothetical protein [Verrucomicrobiota bacterium]
MRQCRPTKLSHRCSNSATYGRRAGTAGALDQTHPLAKREADLAALVDGDKAARKRYGHHYEGWTMEDMERLLAGVGEARR